MTNYKELGLVNTKDMFAKAIKGGYAIPAYNFNDMEQLQAIIQACVETRSPVILQVSSGARKYANKNLLRNMARGAVAPALAEVFWFSGTPVLLWGFVAVLEILFTLVLVALNHVNLSAS